MTAPGGLSTSTYGRQALERLRDVVRAAKADDAMATVTILLPNNIAGIVARRYLAREGLDEQRRGIAALKLGTLRRLAEQIAAPRLIDRRPATGPVVSSAWRAALEADPGLFVEVAKHPATVRALVAAHRELRDLSGEALDAVAASSDLTGDVARLHRRVVAVLAARWYDETDLLRTATMLCSEKADVTVEFGSIVLYLPQALSRSETALTVALAAGRELAVCAAFTSNVRADAAVRSSLEHVYPPGPADEDNSAGATVLPTAGAPLDSSALPEKQEPTKSTATEVLTASDSDDEVRCVVRDLVGQLGTGTPAHRIAVLYAAERPYARLLHEHLAAAQITVNGTGTRPVPERAVVRAYLEILELHDADVPRAGLFRAVAEAPIRDANGLRIPVSRWERMSRDAGVVRGDDWQLRLSSRIADHRQTLDAVDSAMSEGQRRRLAYEAETAESLRDFAVDLRNRLKAGAGLTTWSELSSWAHDLFRDLIGQDGELRTLPREEQYAAVALIQTIGALAGLDALGGQPSLTSLRETLEIELESSRPRVGTFGVGVTVGPMSMAIGLDADVVYVLGLAEGVFPGRIREDALLPELARECSLGELTSYRERLNTRHRHLLAAFASGSQRVVASFPRGDLRRQSRHLPSRWLLPTLRALSGNPALAATEWEELTQDSAQTWVHTAPSYAGGIETSTSLAHEQDWRARSSRAGEVPDEPVIIEALQMIYARDTTDFTRYDGNLVGVQGLPSHADSERAISPTSLEMFAKCPHAFLVERLLGIYPAEHPEALVTISVLDIGTLIHECLDELIKEFEADLPGYGEAWQQAHHVRLIEIAELKAAQLEQAGRLGHHRLWAQERARVHADLHRILDWDSEMRAELDARVVTSELTFGMHGQPAVSVELPDGRRILMRGAADKIDEQRDGTLIVTDVKTGSTRSFKGLGESDPTLRGSKLQLPVYAYAARERLNAPDVPIVAQYWFVRGKGGTVTVPLTPEVELRYGTDLQTIVDSIAAGVFPQRAPADDDYGYVRCQYCNPAGGGYKEARTRWAAKKDAPALAAYRSLIEPGAAAVGTA